MAPGVQLGFTNEEVHSSGNGKKVFAGLQTVNKLFNVNVFSFVYLSTLAMPALARSGATDQHGGQLVVVTSLAGKLGPELFKIVLNTAGSMWLP